MTTCIVCGNPTFVYNSRNRAGHVMRKYKCADNHRFETQELLTTAVDQLRAEVAKLDAMRKTLALEAA